MKIAENIAKDIQYEMLRLYEEDESLAGYILRPFDNTNEMEVRACWQFGVDLIYRLLKSGICEVAGAPLIEPDYWPDPNEPADKAEARLRLLINELASVDPFDHSDENFEAAGIWIAPLIFLTDMGNALLKKYNLTDWEAPLNEAFMEEVEALWEAAGVGWQEEPLFPIKPKQ